MPLSSFDVVSAPCWFWASHFKATALSFALCVASPVICANFREHGITTTSTTTTAPTTSNIHNTFEISFSCFAVWIWHCRTHLGAIKLRSLQACLIFLCRRSRLEKEVEEKMRPSQAAIERDARAKVEKEAVCSIWGHDSWFYDLTVFHVFHMISL